MMKSELISRIKANEKILKRVNKAKENDEVLYSMISSNLVTWDELQEICKDYKHQDEFYKQCVVEVING